MTFLKQFNVSISEKDKNGSTPLHWAAYLGCELSVLLLLAWEHPTNCYDNDGLTPLHLGTMAGNIRIVRYLLMKGAERLQKDNIGRTAIDAATENHMNALIPLLQPPGILETVGIRPPLTPYTEDWCSFLTFFCLYFGGNLYILIFVLLDEEDLSIQGLVHVLIILATAILFVIVTNKDPGYINHVPGQTLL